MELIIEQHKTTKFSFSILKELDNETQYTYFGARYLDSEISIWLSVDPLADQRPWLSPYNYCQLNPIGRIDPTGALDGEILDGFTIDRSGNIQRVDNTGGNEYDVLYNKTDYDAGKRDYDESGTKSGIKIDRSRIKEFSREEIPFYDTSPEEYSYAYFSRISLSDQTTAINLFEFCVKSTNNGIEFNHQFYNKGNLTLNEVSTFAQDNFVPKGMERAKELEKNGWVLTRDDHNHPSNSPKPSKGTSIRGEKQGDVYYKQDIQKFAPNAVFNIYTSEKINNKNYHPY